jgi:hypothetical protein
MIYPIVSAEKWAKQYSITVKSNPCAACGKILHPTKPFATGNWRGLISEPHSCGEEFALILATKSTPKERIKYTDLFHVLKNQFSCDLQ